MSETPASEQFVAFAKGVNESAKLTNIVMAAVKESAPEFLLSERHRIANTVVAALRKAGYLAEGEIQYTGHGRTFVVEEGELQPGEATHWRRLSRWVAVDSGEDSDE